MYKSKILIRVYKKQNKFINEVLTKYIVINNDVRKA